MSGAIALRRELVDARIEVAGDVPGVARGRAPRASRAARRRSCARGAPARARHSASSAPPRVPEAPRLEVGGVVQDEERIAHRARTRAATTSSTIDARAR